MTCASAFAAAKSADERNCRQRRPLAETVTFAAGDSVGVARRAKSKCEISLDRGERGSAVSPARGAPKLNVGVSKTDKRHGLVTVRS
jgi:hypothetical protein